MGHPHYEETLAINGSWATATARPKSSTTQVSMLAEHGHSQQAGEAWQAALAILEQLELRALALASAAISHREQRGYRE